MTEEKSLWICFDAVHNSNPSNEIHDVLWQCKIQIIPTLMPSVTVNPLQSQLRGWCCSVGHAKISFLLPNCFKIRLLWYCKLNSQGNVCGNVFYRIVLAALCSVVRTTVSKRVVHAGLSANLKNTFLREKG